MGNVVFNLASPWCPSTSEYVNQDKNKTNSLNDGKDNNCITSWKRCSLNTMYLQIAIFLLPLPLCTSRYQEGKWWGCRVPLKNIYYHAIYYMQHHYCSIKCLLFLQNCNSSLCHWFQIQCNWCFWTTLLLMIISIFN